MNCFVINKNTFIYPLKIIWDKIANTRVKISTFATHYSFYDHCFFYNPFSSTRYEILSKFKALKSNLHSRIQKHIHPSSLRVSKLPVQSSFILIDKPFRFVQLRLKNFFTTVFDKLKNYSHIFDIPSELQYHQG